MFLIYYSIMFLVDETKQQTVPSSETDAVEELNDHKDVDPRRTITETTVEDEPHFHAPKNNVPQIFSETSFTSQASSVSLSPNARWRPNQDLMFQWDFLPKQPLNCDQGKEIPTLPPTSGYQPEPPNGWHWVAGFGKKAIIEPPDPSGGEHPETPHKPAAPIKSVETIDEPSCKSALLNFAIERGYGTGLAKNHTPSTVKPCTLLKLTLETFCEMRMAGYSFEPYKGYDLGNDDFKCPNPWSIPMYPNKEFETHTKKIEVPNSAIAKECYTCNERGFNRCWKCHGLGQLLCHMCDGARMIKVKNEQGEETEEEEDCVACGGYNGADGREQCELCDGDGRLECNVCLGYRQLKIFIELAVVFTNHIEEFNIDESGLPKQEVANLPLETLYEQVLPRVNPINDYKVGSIVNASKTMIMKHRQAFPDEKTVKQRLKLQSVALSSVTYKQKDINAKYWVYGTKQPDYQVYAPDYPTAKSFVCTIL